MITCAHPKLIFKHMVELPHCECVFCSAEEEQTHRTKIYLVFKERHKVYQRNGIKGNWEEVTHRDDYAHVWEAFEHAVTDRRIPSFVAATPDIAML